MSAEFFSRPPLAALAEKGRRIMEVILHIGAQRSATTTLQSYLRTNAPALKAQGIGFWGPLRTRHGGLLSGVAPEKPADAVALRIADARAGVSQALATAARRGVSQLIVSDENMLGTVRRNLCHGALYPGAEARLARFAALFDGAVTRVALAIRGLDAYWASACAFAVNRGALPPSVADLATLAGSRRSWRSVVQDSAAAFPGATLEVYPHEDFASRPDLRLWHMTGGAVTPPARDPDLWLHRSPTLRELRAAMAGRGQDPHILPPGDGPWQPFDDRQRAQLRETHADDLFWLSAGAGGLATLIKKDQPDQAGLNLPGGATTRGHRHDRQEGRLARTG